MEDRVAKLTAFYEKHDPSKLERVLHICENFDEEQLNAMLRNKYGEDPNDLFAQPMSDSRHRPKARKKRQGRQSVMLMDNMQGTQHGYYDVVLVVGE